VLDTAGGGLARGRAGSSLEAAQCRGRRQGSTPLRLGLAALPVRYGPGLEVGPPDPAPQIAKSDEFTFYLTLSPEGST
jgi:hypothetical protein